MVPQKGQVYFPPLFETVSGPPQELHLWVMTLAICLLHKVIIETGLSEMYVILHPGTLRLKNVNWNIIQYLENAVSGYKERTCTLERKCWMWMSVIPKRSEGSDRRMGKISHPCGVRNDTGTGCGCLSCRSKARDLTDDRGRFLTSAGFEMIRERLRIFVIPKRSEGSDRRLGKISHPCGVRNDSGTGCGCLSSRSKARDLTEDWQDFSPLQGSK